MTMRLLFAALIGVACFAGVQLVPGAAENSWVLYTTVVGGALAAFCGATLVSRYRGSTSDADVFPTSKSHGAKRPHTGATPPILHRGGTPTTARGTLGTGKAVDPCCHTGQGPTSFRVGAAGSRTHLDVSTEKLEDGTTKVTVICVGYTKTEFNKIRPRLEKVQQIKWAFPSNLGDGRRKMGGVIKGNVGGALAAIQGISA